MRYNTIKNVDIGNGPGCRVSLWVQGCTHHCKECFNPETWDFNGGKLFTDREYTDLLLALKPSYIHGLSVLGGEPLDQPLSLAPLLATVRMHYPNKTIWLYTGYTYEALTADMSKVIEFVDVLVDGEFIEAEKVIDLRFRGSTNQRIIDMDKTREHGKVILWIDDSDYYNGKLGEVTE